MAILLVFKSVVLDSPIIPVLIFTLIGVDLPPERMVIHAVIAATVTMQIVQDAPIVVLPTVYQAVGDGFITSGV